MRKVFLAAFVIVALLSAASSLRGQQGLGSSASALRHRLAARDSADTTYSFATRLAERREYERALLLLAKAIKLYRSARDTIGEGTAWVRSGIIMEDMAAYKDALAAYNTGLALHAAAKFPEGLATGFDRIAGVELLLGEYDHALTHYQKSLELKRATKDPRGEGLALSNLGVTYDYLGNYSEALRYQADARRLQEQLPDSQGLAKTFGNIAGVYANRGEFTNALEYFHRARALEEQLKDSVNLRITFANLSVTYVNLGNHDDAVRFAEAALTLARALDDVQGETNALNSLAGLYDDAGDSTAALSAYREALRNWRRIKDRDGQATAEHNLGVFFLYHDRPDSARAHLLRAVRIRDSLGVEAEAAVTHAALAAALVMLKRFEPALQEYRRALRAQERAGDRVAQAFTLDGIADLFEKAGDEGQSLHFHSQAVRMAETARADVHVEEVSSALGDKLAALYSNTVAFLVDHDRPGDAFDYAERSRARTFLDVLGNGKVDFRRSAPSDLLAAERAVLAEMDSLQRTINRGHDRESKGLQRELVLANALSDAKARYADIEMRLKLASPQYGSLVSVAPISEAELQTRVLRDSVTLVEYYVLDRFVVAWIIDDSAVVPTVLRVPRDSLTQAIALFRSQIAARSDVTESAAWLYDKLIRPLTPKIRRRTLVIVPHAVLHYLPFAALWDGAKKQYLVQQYTVSYSPSASVLGLVIDKSPAVSPRLLALGNPDGSLPYAAAEVDSVGRLFNTAVSVGQAATETALRARVQSADIVHLAAHGAFNETNPLFSRIELAGDSINDGLLEAREIFELRLPRGALVVLSACNTAMGRVGEGEEIVGLTRAFMYAGASSVISTLWSIDDVSSAALLTEFFRSRRAAAGTAEALRNAQVRVLDDPKWSHPYFWAAFSLTGNFK